MGLKQLQHRSSAVGAVTVSREDIGPGVLRSLTALAGIGGTSKGEIYIRVTLERGQRDNIMAVATPIEDYLFDGNQPHWDGDIPLDPGDIICLTTISSATRTITLNCATSCGLTPAQSKAC